MKFGYSIKQKTKIAILLFCIMACTILIRFLEDKSVQNMNHSFVSLYNDRLIPATDLFYIAEYVDQKRLLLDNALYPAVHYVFDEKHLKAGLNKINNSIDSLISGYEKTYLVTQEKEQMALLKKILWGNKVFEEKTLTTIKDEGLERARVAHEVFGRNSSSEIIRQLSELMRIQRMVGQELIKDTEFMVSGNKLYSSLQMVLAIVIGILIVGIIFTSNVVKIKNEKFNLN
jgi:hypothetical protein